ncbi:hypothetical protein Vretimale_18240 [Volvox reticuliferus]|uniref:Uncharacterized protein n=1 Tax=Volvox reticuliferus TaxID=1737510 RepID=A0A8J4GXZ0_9CHLO|nr:hypothetical protein Vretifemale_18012 [Volvox reticuliferus]GIM15462.1 hypothetical protein Vretimale_18240 [Volvox reticuliferus]
MGLFSRNKRQQQQQQQQQQQTPREKSSPPRPAPVTLYEPLPAAPEPRPPAVHPPSSLNTNFPQPEPSPAQYQQRIFHQTYQILQQRDQQQDAPSLHQNNNHIPTGVVPPGAAGPYTHPDAAGSAPAVGTATLANDGGATSTALLRQAVRAAAREGKPLTLNFVGQMQPVMANNPYGISMPHQHPYGPPQLPPQGYGGVLPPQGYGGVLSPQGYGGVLSPQGYGGVLSPQGYGMPPGPPDGWQPGTGQDPYDTIRIPALPDMRNMPAELQDFRDQCATGVRQAVAMITAMEHQLWWERSRRQQAEEDCKVLLAAVQMERGVGEALLGAEEQRRVAAAAAASKLTLAADELPQASEAATTIQKHIRGHLARKEFESNLRDILRGVDPSLDPAALPSAAQSHISHVNSTGAPHRLGLRTLLGEVAGGPSSSTLSPEQADATAYYRRQVDRIGKRLASHKDAGQPHPDDTSGDPLHRDVKELLSGSYPASSAQVIAALVRRCRELQAALLEAVGDLQQAQLTIQGLKDANAKVAELSNVRADLEASRQDNLRLVAMVAKLRTALGLQAAGAGVGGSSAGGARENPYVAAWYRRAYADQEWQRVPPRGPGGVALLDGPDTAVETWDDLRASVPEPVLVPKIAVPGTQYRDLMTLKQDMIRTAAQGPSDPLYSMSVPDRSGFMYERDTPLVPMQSTGPLIRESMPPDISLGLNYLDIQRQQSPQNPAHAGGSGTTHVSSIGPNYQQQQQLQGLESQQQLQQEGPLVGSRAGSFAESGGGRSGTKAISGGGWPGGGGGVGSVGGSSFRYNKDTPVVPVYSVLPLIREDEFIRRSTSPPRDAALLQPATPPPLQHEQQYSLTAAATATPATSRQPSYTGLPTNMQYIRDRIPAAAPTSMSQSPHQLIPPDVVAGAAAAMTLHHHRQQQGQ